MSLIMSWSLQNQFRLLYFLGKSDQEFYQTNYVLQDLRNLIVLLWHNYQNIEDDI